MDRVDVLALEVRAGFARVEAGMAELRATLAGSRTEWAESRLQQADRHATLMDAIVDLRNEHRGHTHDG
jgi:hypothetical protein